MPLIVIAEFMDEAAVARLAARAEVRYEPTLVDRPEALREAVREAEVLIVRNRTQVRGALLEAMPRCRIVGRLGVGLDNIDVAACAARGLAVIPATGANARSVAEYVVAMAMVLLRGAYLSTGEVAAGRWPRASLSEGREAGGRTLGLVGFGSIGQLAADLARPLGFRVQASDTFLAADHPAWAAHGTTPVALDTLVGTSDVVSLHVPLDAGTRRLFDAARIAAMPAGAVLINTARGGIVDEAALAAALKRGRLGGAALDVFEDEPLPAGSPLADAPRLVLTPHIAGVTRESNARVSQLIADKVLEALELA